MGGAASAQVSVEECIAQNGPRYETPSDATTAQYIDTGGLCRDAASGGGLLRANLIVASGTMVSRLTCCGRSFAFSL